MKKIKPVNLFALFVIAFVAYAYFFEYKRDEDEKVTKSEASKLFKIKEDDVAAINLKWGGGETKMKKGTNGWEMSAPVQDFVDDAAINTFLRAVVDESSESTVTEDPKADLAIFGLNDPLGTVEVIGKDGKSQMISFGQVDAIGGKKYILSAGKVYLAGGPVQAHFQKTFKDFRDKRIMRMGLPKVIALNLKLNTPKNKYEIGLKSENGKWSYVGRSAEVDNKTVEDFLLKLQGLRVSDFVSEAKNSAEAKKLYKTNMVLAVYDVVSQDGQHETLTVHDFDKEGKATATLASQGTVYQILQNTLAPLDVRADYFRNRKKPFEFNRDKVERIEIQTDLTRLDLTKEGQDWKETKPPEGSTLDQGQISRLIDMVSSLEATGFVSDKGGLQKPAGAIVFKTKEGAPEFEMKWGKDLNDQDRLVLTNKSGEAISVNKQSLAALPFQTLRQQKPKAGEVKTQEVSGKK